MSETYCIAFMEYMFAGKTLLDYTSLFFPNDYKKNDKIMRKCFKRKHVRVYIKRNRYNKKLSFGRNKS